VAAALRRALGVVLGVLVAIWVRTLRVTLRVAPELDPGEQRPLVLAFWHGQQLPLLAWPRRRRLSVLVSWSSDGELQAGVMRALGMDVVRGSSSRGGAAGLAALIKRLLGGGRDAAFAVDGPRGPVRRAKPGAARAAELAGGVLVPMACACERVRTLTRAWDQFELPLPFSRVAIVLGAPIEPGPNVDQRLETALERGRAEAANALCERPSTRLTASAR
jgi:hypothetical protein